MSLWRQTPGVAAIRGNVPSAVLRRGHVRVYARIRGNQWSGREIASGHVPTGSALECTSCRQSCHSSVIRGLVARRGVACTGKVFIYVHARTQRPQRCTVRTCTGLRRRHIKVPLIHVDTCGDILGSAPLTAALALHATHDSHAVRRQPLSRRPDSILSVALH